jgi:hypothetical protein
MDRHARATARRRSRRTTRRYDMTSNAREHDRVPSSSRSGDHDAPLVQRVPPVDPKSSMIGMFTAPTIDSTAQAPIVRGADRRSRCAGRDRTPEVQEQQDELGGHAAQSPYAQYRAPLGRPHSGLPSSSAMNVIHAAGGARAPARASPRRRC